MLEGKITYKLLFADDPHEIGRFTIREKKTEVSLPDSKSLEESRSVQETVERLVRNLQQSCGAFGRLYDSSYDIKSGIGVEITKEI